MKDGLFHFKRFFVSHGKGSMKVGVDGVLVGAWASAAGSRVLDAGTGCGVIALMLAQRIEGADIFAIDIDPASVEEARQNFQMSLWKDRLSVERVPFSELSANGGGKYDLIVSNPPFFNSGVDSPSTSREIARHQSDFSPAALIEEGVGLLNAGGRLAMIVPSECFGRLREHSLSKGLRLDRALFVRNHHTSAVKRILMEFVKPGEESDNKASLTDSEIVVMTMFGDDGGPTPEYRELCKDFYLKF